MAAARRFATENRSRSGRAVAVVLCAGAAWSRGVADCRTFLMYDTCVYIHICICIYTYIHVHIYI